jgi:uncharacterized spore protein YtfJ
MDLHFEELLGQVTDFIKSEAKTDTVVGEQFELGEFKYVPVIKVGMGFGSGGGGGTETKGSKGKGAGAGAAVGIEPIGFLVSREKEISFLAAGKTHGLAAVFEKAPDLIEKIMENRSKQKDSA